MAASPGGGIGAAYFLLKPVVRTLVHQARATAASTTNSAKSTILHNQLKQLPRSSHYVKHTSYNLRKQVQRLVRSAWEGIARPIPAGHAPRTVAYPSSTTQATSRIAVGHDASLVAKYADIIRSAFFRTSPSFPRGASMTSQLGIRPSPSRAFAYARTHGAGSSFGVGAAGRARVHQASLRLGGQSSGGSGRNYGSGAKVLREISNVPIGMRALADRLRESDEKVAARKTARVGTGKPYERTGKNLVGQGRRESITLVKQNRSSVTPKNTTRQETLEAYFPIASGSSGPGTNAAPDLSMDTYLLIPLCPALGELMSQPDQPTTRPTHRLMDDPGPSASFLPSQSGSSQSLDAIPRFPNLLSDLFDIHIAFTAHTDHRVIPLLNRLSGRGVFGPHTRAGDGRAEAEVIFGPAQVPEALRLRFEGVSKGTVRDMMGGGNGTGKDWYHVYSVPRREQAVEATLVAFPGEAAAFANGAYSDVGEAAVLALTPEENAWRMPVLNAAGSSIGTNGVRVPDIPVPIWNSLEEVASQPTFDSPYDTPSTSSGGSLSPAHLDSPTSSTFDFDFDNFSVQLDGQISDMESMGSPSVLAEMEDTDFPDWTDAELEFGDEEESVVESGAFVSSEVEMELGEEEQTVWAAAILSGAESTLREGQAGERNSFVYLL